MYVDGWLQIDLAMSAGYKQYCLRSTTTGVMFGSMTSNEPRKRSEDEVRSRNFADAIGQSWLFR